MKSFEKWGLWKGGSIAWQNCSITLEQFSGSGMDTYQSHIGLQLVGKILCENEFFTYLILLTWHSRILEFLFKIFIKREESCVDTSKCSTSNCFIVSGRMNLMITSLGCFCNIQLERSAAEVDGVKWCWMVWDSGIEEYQFNWSRTPGAEICGETWMPRQFAMTRDDVGNHEEYSRQFW